MRIENVKTKLKSSKKKSRENKNWNQNPDPTKTVQFLHMKKAGRDSLRNNIVKNKPNYYNETVHIVSFDSFLSSLGWILNLEFCLQKLLTFYQKLLWNIRSRLNSSTFWVFRPVFKCLFKIGAFCTQKKILIKYI